MRWDRWLKSRGVPAEAIDLDPTEPWRFPMRTRLHRKILAHWEWTERETSRVARELLAAIDEPARLIEIAARELGLRPPALSPPPHLDLREAIGACCMELSPEDREKLERAVAKVPDDVKKAAARIVAVLPTVVNAVAHGVPFSNWHTAWQKLNAGELTLNEMVEKTDRDALCAGAAGLADACALARKLKPTSEPFDFSWPTLFGTIRLVGGDDRDINLDGAAVVIVCGARPTLRFAGNRGPATAIVCAGDGAQFRELPAAIFGVQVVFACGRGNTFLSTGEGGGAAHSGVSLIHCGRGGNRFDGRSFCQGAADAGVAIVAVRGSGNVFLCDERAQGYGGPGGFGAIVGLKGGDSFEARVDPIGRPAQDHDPESSISLAQGVGAGFRSPERPEDDLPGGIGLVVEGGGKNRFKCGIFGQGAGYLFGVGAVVVNGPNNIFHGDWYCQGAAAHMAAGCLLDRGGAGEFRLELNHGQGAGNDRSIGLLHTAGRGSRFLGGSRGPRGTQRCGASHTHGIGICIADEGTNIYQYSEESFGFVVRREGTSYVKGLPAFGLLFDGGTPAFEDGTPLTSHSEQEWSPEEPILGARWVGPVDLFS